MFLPPSCDPVPDCLRHKTVRSGCLGYRPGLLDDLENDLFLKFRTIFRCRHDLILPHDHFTHRPKNTKHSSPLNSVPYVPLRLFRGPTRPRTVAAAASSPPARSALTTKSHTTSDAACRSSRLRSPLTEEPPEEPPGVGRQNHTNAATRTTPPSTSHNERNNTPRPHGTAPLGDDSGTPPRTPPPTAQEPQEWRPGDRASTISSQDRNPTDQPRRASAWIAETASRFASRCRRRPPPRGRRPAPSRGGAVVLRGRRGIRPRAPSCREVQGAHRVPADGGRPRVAGEASAAVRATSAGTTTSAVGRGEDAG